MELASAENGVDLCDLWLEVAEDTYTVRYMDSLAPAAESNANGDGFGEDGVEEPRCGSWDSTAVPQASCDSLRAPPAPAFFRY